MATIRMPGLSARSHGELRSMRKRIAALAAPRALLAGAGDGVNGARLEIDDADLVVLGVGDVELIASRGARPCGR